MSERIVPPPLPSANPVSASMPPPLPAPGGAKPPLLPDHPPPPVKSELAPQAVERATTDELFAFPPALEPVAKAQTQAADPLPGPLELADESPVKTEAKASQASPAKRIAWIVGVVVVVLLAVVAYFLFGKGQSGVVPAKPGSATTFVQKATPDVPPVPEASQPPEPQPEPAAEVAPVPEEKPSPKAAVPSPRVKTNEPAAKRLEHLEGAFYLFGNSIQKTSRGYRMAYAVLNADIAPGSELSGKVKSQVFRVLVNCQNSTWGYDQRYYHARQFGEGDRLDERVWVINEVKFKPIRDSVQDKRMYELMCR